MLLWGSVCVFVCACAPSVAGQLLARELHHVVCVETVQIPAVKEKLAASLILLRVALLLGLSIEKGGFTSGGGGALLSAASSAPPGRSGGSDAPSAATSGSPFTEITRQEQAERTTHERKEREGRKRLIKTSGW